MIYHPYTLTLDAPLLLTTTEGDPNSSESLDFIPGSSVRGAVARALCVRGVDRADPAAFRRLVLSGEVCYLNAYVVTQGRRCLPTPVSFRREKDDESGRGYDLAGPGDDWRDKQLVRLKQTYLTLGAADLHPGQVESSGRFHHQRDRQVGRPTPDVGAIFRYDALEAEQQFGGLIVLSSAGIAGDFERLQEALGGSVLLGRSRRSGYGGAARLTWATDTPDREIPVPRNRLIEASVAKDSCFRLLLTADYLGRDPNTGQLDPAALEAELQRRFTLPVEMLRKCFKEFRRTGGYNQKWGLELPQVLALKAGSIFLMRARESIPLDRLVAVEHAGLGERRAEGFGRVVFLDEPGTVIRVVELTPSRATPPSTSPGPVIQAMQQRLLWDALEQEIARTAADLVRPARDLPTRSLLGRLRVPLRGAPIHALQELHRWMTDEAAGLRKPARRQLQACFVGERQTRQSLIDFLAGLTAVGSDAGRLLNYAKIRQRHYFVSAEEVSALLAAPEWDARIKARLIAAVLAALARKSATVTEVDHG